ncbi:hypothetical protein [Pseudomonas amygdali]
MKRLLEHNTVLPEIFHSAYKLCFDIHDVLAQLLVSGMKQGVFVTDIILESDRDKKAIDEADDLIDWLRLSGRIEEEADVLVTFAFPAVLSDMLHCIFEAIEASRKGKLAVSFMLLRKPIQESLYLLESIVLDKNSFSALIADDPSKLRPQNAGGVEGHSRRISNVLNLIGASGRFDAEYLAKLRYDKTEQDSFDGVCNKAMHLFTDHKAIKTEQYNINFIFSSGLQSHTQWSFLYSRLPYMLMYILALVEYITERFAQTFPVYSQDMARRLGASLILSNACIGREYFRDHIDHLACETYRWLSDHCLSNGFVKPETEHFERMASSGAFPGEPQSDVDARNRLYEQLAGL